ncbi:hypothetical protein DFQ27_004728 [Actinomortierella ambigua]|uniref:Myb-like domain-containing protein n=1 Tax=Actinomortierella ambigua TaxID=1343610 RepID=A0A9P6Q558_9FUNG|nr:hypothetical protein DFQ27_004728 [Actinomortierella ambigua]
MESTEGEQLFTQIAPSPLGKINNSLKRIRLQDEADSSGEGGQATSRSDSFERAWGDINVGDLNDSDFEDEPLVRKVSIPEQKRLKKEDPKSPPSTMNPAEKYFATHSFPPAAKPAGSSSTTVSTAKAMGSGSGSSSFASSSKAGSSSSAASSSKTIFSRFFTKGPTNTATTSNNSGNNNNSNKSGEGTVSQASTTSSAATSLFTSISADPHDEEDIQGSHTVISGSAPPSSSSSLPAPSRPSITTISKPASSSLGSSTFKQKKVVTHKTKAGTRSNNGAEDVFSHDQVKHWSEVRIKTWEHRRLNVEGFYYRFCDPTEMQHNGAWSTKSKQEFLTRLEEWKQRGIRIGTSWGVFSMAVSHKAGYQCSSYYRKLLETKQLTDPNYAWEGGKLVMINKTSGGEMALSGLSERWETEEVMEIERNINEWIKLYHSNGPKPSVPRAPKLPSLPLDGSKTSSSNAAGKKPASTTTTTTTSITTTTNTVFRPRQEAPRVKATTAPVVHRQISVLRGGRQSSAEAEVLTSVDIEDKFAEYSSFMKEQSTRSPARPSIRESLSLHVPSNIGPTSATPAPGRSVVSLEVRKAPVANTNAKGQMGLSLFWKNIRPVRVECPDVPKYMIPKDVEQRPTWAHRIIPYKESEPVVEGVVYKEVSSIVDMDWDLLSEGLDAPIGDLQGIMADPPWNFIVADGRNDGKCSLTLDRFTSVMEKALELVPSGIVCVWTHKAILPDVVAVMHRLRCRYVENLVWYKLGLHNANLDRASPYFRSSKEILLMFKRGEGFDIRHQRTADVIMDFEKPTTAWIEDEWTEPKPEAVFEMMEILLPDARFSPELGRGRLLELWAKRGQERRTGWISVHEQKAAAQPLLSSSSASADSYMAAPTRTALATTSKPMHQPVSITIVDDDDDDDGEDAKVERPPLEDEENNGSEAVSEGENDDDDDLGNVADMEDAGDEGAEDRVGQSEVGSPASGIQTPNTLELMELEDGLSDFSEEMAPLSTVARDSQGQAMDLE